jgi:hypothetical protein
MENRDPKKYKEFVRSRNKVKTMVRKAKIQMEKEIAENAKVNPKKFWQYANPLCRNSISVWHCLLSHSSN